MWDAYWALYYIVQYGIRRFRNGLEAEATNCRKEPLDRRGKPEDPSSRLYKGPITDPSNFDRLARNIPTITKVPEIDWGNNKTVEIIVILSGRYFSSSPDLDN
jgi:hypothetical protein